VAEEGLHVGAQGLIVAVDGGPVRRFASDPGAANAGLWGSKNAVTAGEPNCYAARSYSLMSPPRTGRRLIL
jgi:hypothetical protein